MEKQIHEQRDLATYICMCARARLWIPRGDILSETYQKGLERQRSIAQVTLHFSCGRLWVQISQSAVGQGIFELNLRGTKCNDQTSRRMEATRLDQQFVEALTEYEDCAWKVLALLWKLLLQFMGVHHVFHSPSWKFLSPAMVGVPFPTRTFMYIYGPFTRKRFRLDALMQQGLKTAEAKDLAHNKLHKVKSIDKKI